MGRATVKCQVCEAPHSFDRKEKSYTFTECTGDEARQKLALVPGAGAAVPWELLREGCCFVAGEHVLLNGPRLHQVP